MNEPGGRGRRPRRSVLLLAAILLLPVLEIAVAVQIGVRIGAIPTLLALLVLSAVGVLVLRRVGLSALRTLNTPIIDRPPGPPPADTALVVVAGLLLLLPGFVTGAAGLVLLLPPVRRPLARRMSAAVSQRVDLRRGRVVVHGEVIQG